MAWISKLDTEFFLQGFEMIILNLGYFIESERFGMSDCLIKK